MQGVVEGGKKGKSTNLCRPREDRVSAILPGSSSLFVKPIHQQLEISELVSRHYSRSRLVLMETEKSDAEKAC